MSYDYSVRKSDGSIVQFIYGEDGVDVMNTAYLNGEEKTFDFIVKNFKAVAYKLSMTPTLLEDLGLDVAASDTFHKEIVAAKSAMKSTSDKELSKGDVVMVRKLRPGCSVYRIGECTNEFYFAKISKVRSKEGDSSSYDVRWLSDDTVSKKVPVYINGPDSNRAGKDSLLS